MWLLGANRGLSGFSGLKVWIGRTSILSIVPVVTFGSRFARNVILSRLLVPDEFGAALAITTVLGLVGLATDVALDRFVMLNDSSRALAAAHLVSVIRGFLVAAVLVVAAPVAADVFGVARLWMSFAATAIVPVVLGFAHLGIRRVQKNFDYGPESIAQLAANLVAVAALFPALALFSDHRAIVVSFVVEAIAYVIASHLLARIPFRLNSEMEIIRQALSFGIPLTVNGVGLAILYQLDRVLVGHWFGVKVLALYAVILSLSVVPVSMVVHVFGSLSFSFLISDTERSASRYHLLLRLYNLLATGCALAIAVMLDVVTPLIFGPAFKVDQGIHVLITVIAALRLQRGGAPTSVLLAYGRTKALALLNLSSGVGLAVAIAGVVLWPTLESVLAGIAIGELLSILLFLTVSEAVVHSRTGVLKAFCEAIIGPMVIAGALACAPAMTWTMRGGIVMLGLIVLLTQTIFAAGERNSYVRLFSKTHAQTGSE